MSKEPSKPANDLFASKYAPSTSETIPQQETRPQHQPRSKRLSYALPKTPPPASGSRTPQDQPPPQMNTTDITDSLSSSASAPTQQNRPHEPEVEQNTHESALQAELASIQRINAVIEGVLSSLDKAHTNMDTLSATISNSTTLLDTWTRILSQTEHNQRLLLHPSWQGASQDIADAENESMTRRREQERREAEEAARREAQEEQRRRAEEERQRRQAESERKGAVGRTPRAGSRAGSAASRSRAMGTVAGRATTTSTTTATGTGGSSAGQTTAERRAAGRAAVSGYGRVGSAGTKPARGRGRGTGTS